MARDIFPADDGAFRRIAPESGGAVKGREDKGGLSRGELRKLREAIEEYTVEIERYKEMRIALSDQAGQRESKRITVRRPLEEYMETAGYDPRNQESRRRYVKGGESPVIQAEAAPVTDPRT